MKRNIHILHILQSQKPDPIEKTGHTIRLRCACVWNLSEWSSHPFLHDSIFYFEIWAISPFFFLFPCFRARTHFLFSLLLHSPYFYHNEYEESCQRDGAFLCGWEAYFYVTSNVEVSMYIWSVRDLNLKSMK